MNRLNPIRLAIVGCGRAAEHLYAPALRELRDVRLVAAVDPLPVRRALIARQFPGCTEYDDLGAMLANAEAQGVIIASPPVHHLPMLRMVLDARMPALVEKPLAQSMQGLHELSARLGRENIFVAVGYNRRFRRPVRQLRRVMQARPASQIVHVRYVLASDAAAWAPITGVIDPLEDLGSHQLDLLRHVFNREISAIRADRPDPMICELHVKLTTQITAHCTCSQADHAREDMEIETGGRRYRLHIGSERIAPPTGPLRSAIDAFDIARRKVTGGRSSFKRSYTRQIEAFAAHVRGEPDPPRELATFADGLAAVEAVDAARRSIEQRQEIELP